MAKVAQVWNWGGAVWGRVGMYDPGFYGRPHHLTYTQRALSYRPDG